MKKSFPINALLVATLLTGCSADSALETVGNVAETIEDASATVTELSENVEQLQEDAEGLLQNTADSLNPAILLYKEKSIGNGSD